MTETILLPTGAVTFLFTDIEGSTRLWEQQTEAMHRDLARHDALLRAAIEEHDGHVFKTVGDAFYAAFSRPQGAVQAALEAQRALRRELPHVRVRMAVHTGHAEERDGDYFGPALNHVARLLAAGHGGQVLLSRPTAEAVRAGLPADTSLRFLGEHRLRDIAATETIFQLAPPDLPSKFPPLNTLDVAFRRGVMRTSAIAGVVLLIMLGLTAWAIENGHAAERNELRALLQQRRADEKASEARREATRADANATVARREAGIAEAQRRDAVAARTRAEGAEKGERAQRKVAEGARDDARQAQGVAVEQRGRAETQATIARDRAVRLRRLLYASEVSQGQQACEVSDRTRAEDLLVAQRPEPGQGDLRSFEWRYLWRLSHRDDALFTLQPRKGIVAAIAFSPDGKIPATASWHHFLKLWDVGSKRNMATFDGARFGHHRGDLFRHGARPRVRRQRRNRKGVGSRVEARDRQPSGDKSGRRQAMLKSGWQNPRCRKWDTDHYPVGSGHAEAVDDDPERDA